MSSLYSILIVGSLIVIFIVVTIINLKTKKPDDCVSEESNCNTCTFTCIHNKQNKDE